MKRRLFISLLSLSMVFSGAFSANVYATELTTTTVGAPGTSGAATAASGMVDATANTDATTDVADAAEGELTAEGEVAEPTEAELLAQAYAGRRIPAGISIEGVNVTGMTYDEAQAVVDNYVSAYNTATITLTAEDRSVSATPAEIGIKAKNSDVIARAMDYGNTGNPMQRFLAETNSKYGVDKNFKISIEADKDKIAAYLTEQSPTLNKEAVNNKIHRGSEGFEFISGTNGMEVVEDSATVQIADYLTYQWDKVSDATLKLPVQVVEPRGSREELMSLTDTLGSYSTNYSTSGAGRKKNLSNGASLINGALLYPGEEFSVYQHLIPFSAENGYELAGSYENGTTVQTYGGGICQVSSTLYGALRAAEIEIVTRCCHSMIVNYVDPSEDAAISVGGKDLQFRNNKNYPIYIEGYTTNNTDIHFNIYGKEERPANRKVSYESEVTEQVTAGTTYVADANQPVGYLHQTSKAHTGYTARLWKTVTVDGAEESRKVYNNSRYYPSNRVIAVGVATGDANIYGEIMSAVNSQNSDVVNATVMKYGGAPILVEPGGIVTTPSSQSTEVTVIQ